MITITKTEIDIKDIRELAATYKDIAEGYGNADIHGNPPNEFYETALALLQLINVHSDQLKGMSAGVKEPASQ